ncbi:unnamed protein product [Plutella xylostella]|uniref:DNA repair and recombination protein RAD54-like n=1 Tax=Plutella xylostella TaxID=51655 RepID=A0A8S4FM71_PLUXY|nr:unnamed protein product [Plutella xylostella]
MVDINKYLETQLALAKQRCELKNNDKEKLVSSKSKAAADLISKKQDRQSHKSNPNKNSEPDFQIPSTSSVVKSDDDSDYQPSGDDEDEVPQKTVTPHPRPRQRQNVKKILDDGDKAVYNERIKIWRNNLNAACAGKFEESSLTADIQYICDGNKDPEEIHELQNGLCIPTYIWKRLYKYQRVGVKWLWELHQIQAGGLLGDEMGLGKTVQIIAFLAGLSKTDGGAWGGLGPSIIVAPATVIYQWVSHFHYWCPHLRVAVLHHSGSHGGNHHKLIRDIHASHGILLITYAGIVKYSKDLLSQRWHYIILDEGHKIRNPDTQVSKFVKKFQTPHKLLITGSPMQNSLQELWSLFDFMRPGLLGTHAAFMDHFALPITQGGYANATEIQEATALEIAIALKNMITPYMLRRTKAEVQEHIKLPEKSEQVLFCALSQEQRDLYMGYLMSGTVRSILDKESRYGDPLRARILVALCTLRKICNHPDLYLYEAQEELEEIDEEKFGYWKRSGKMTVVHSLLKIWQKQGHRALIFSQSRAMLCILEQFLQQQDYKYLRMDGTVSVGLRQNIIKTFNENSEYLVFLATTRVGGLGVNLTGADRVIIFDPDWNPATDSQAKERAWRIGQLRNVTVYRLISAGTIEEKIYQRQVFKHLLSNKVLVDPNQKNVLTTSTLQGLFTLEDLNCDGDTETSSLFKHTKVILDKKTKDKKEQKDSESMSYSQKKKLDAMRKMAKAISKKIAANVKNKSNDIDPREEYKKKRELQLNPPVIEEPEVNLVDDKETNVPFDKVISEIDIINMHSKKDYEENLINEVLKAQEQAKIDSVPSTSTDDVQHETIIDDVMDIVDDENETITQPDPKQSSKTDMIKTGEKETASNKKASKRKIESPEPEIDNLVAVKKVKKKKHKHEKNVKSSDDDYVLSKLFAKSTVKNALQHDVVVGLAEKEKRYRVKEEATRKAREAVRAVKFSSK